MSNWEKAQTAIRDALSLVDFTDAKLAQKTLTKSLSMSLDEIKNIRGYLIDTVLDKTHKDVKVNDYAAYAVCILIWANCIERDIEWLNYATVRAFNKRY
jgi:hypothetical protein